MDEIGNNEPFLLGLSSVLETEIVQLGSCKCKDDVGDKVTERAPYVQCASTDIRVLSTRV